MRELRVRRGGLRAAAGAVAVALLQLGCFSFGSHKRDIDETPVVDTGVAATIIYPGQNVPFQPRGNTPAYGAPAPAQPATAPPGVGAAPYPGAGVPPPSGGSALPSAAGPAPSATGEARTSVAPRAPAYSMIGGAERDEVRHDQSHEEPAWAKVVMWPFALLAAPFQALARSDEQSSQTGPELPRPSTVAPPPQRSAPPVSDYETRQQQMLERELDQRAARAGAPTTAPRESSGPPSIADELASLQRTPPPSRAERRAPEPSPATGAAPLATAQGIVDRDGDGRIDQWIFRQGGEIVREEFDDDGDGRPDRRVHYDLASHQVSRVEEDSDRDGRFDSWTDFRDGEVVRRRADANNDGVVDTWTFYRDGQITRHEEDTDGDGFRDRVGFFTGGVLTREERDTNGDGRRDVTIHYDANRHVTLKEEDTDGDGRFDVISHYQQGRLSRRELLNAGGGTN